MNRVAVAVAAVWPGLPLVLCGSIGIGLAAALGFAVVMDLAVGSTWLWWDAGPTGRLLLWALAGAVWVGSAAWTVWLIVAGDPAHHKEEIDGLFRKAQLDLLRGETDQAIAALERVLTLSPTDCDAMVYLAGLYARQGQHRRATRLWQHCRVHDRRDKWRWEAETALAEPAPKRALGAGP